MRRFDVIVVGIGGIGVGEVLHIATRDGNVRAIDPSPIGSSPSPSSIAVHVDAAEQAGATLVIGTRVLDWRPESGVVVIRTE